MQKIGKQDMTDEIMSRTGLSRKDADAALNAVIDIITETMHDNGKVTIPNFGTYEVVTMKQRTGRNIHTDETIIIPPHKKVKFSPGKALKESVK